MTTFGWKRKAGESVEHNASVAFENDAKDEDLDNEVTRGEVDWMTLAPKKRLISLEDARAKSCRLRDEGAILAEAERFWEAIKKWDEALLAMPTDSKVLEMKAQALMSVGEAFPAVQAAQQAVDAEPTWSTAHQTLGRAQLNLGEVKLAIRSFCKAIMLNPTDKDLWEGDLVWACSIRDRMNVSTQSSAASTSSGRDAIDSASTSHNREAIDSAIVSSKDIADMMRCDRKDDEEESSSSVELANEEQEADLQDVSGEQSARSSVLNVPKNFVHLRG